ncbi:MAG: hypothetical protein ACEY3E_05160 [Candidatus Tisiphia sp.]|uniref:hypothetical protein n=1 Tax=Candidatus Tisiphia endosymbiont of Oplodontha viridula TaxID=3077925 RepID=UPI0035C8E2FE
MKNTSKCMEMNKNINISSDNEFSKKQIAVLLVSILLGVGIGWLGFLLFGDIGNQCKIMYVSQKEILKLEKERVSKELEEAKINQQKEKQQPKESNLFFGQINQAIELINEETQKYKDKRTKVIFAADEFITGEGVISISRQVHQNVIENLAKLISNLNQNDLEQLNNNK